MKYLILLVLLTSCLSRGLDTTTNFNIGDCIAFRDFLGKNEFLEPTHIVRKIIKIGKINYLYEYGYRHGFTLQSEMEIKFANRRSVKIECQQGEI